ncbi:hypothetical protein HYX04_02455 [Candidatus Woesearchaeota archaeon]|nr:hypothetical protein [Candidatus Woesearchaeota archaeon]
MTTIDEIGLEIALREDGVIQVARNGAPVTAENVKALTVEELAKCEVVVKDAPVKFGNFRDDGTLADYRWEDIRVPICGIVKSTPAFNFLEKVYNLASLRDPNFGWGY